MLINRRRNKNNLKQAHMAKASREKWKLRPLLLPIPIPLQLPPPFFRHVFVWPLLPCDPVQADERVWRPSVAKGWEQGQRGQAVLEASRSEFSQKGVVCDDPTQEVPFWSYAYLSAQHIPFNEKCRCCVVRGLLLHVGSHLGGNSIYVIFAIGGFVIFLPLADSFCLESTIRPLQSFIPKTHGVTYNCSCK
jgi:hypothetical protein